MMLVERARQNFNRIGVALAVLIIAGALILLPQTDAILVIGGALALLALVHWHELALHVVVFAVPFGQWFPISSSVGNLTAVDVFIALLVALWLARMVAVDRAIVIRFPPLTVPFVWFFGAALFSMTGALSLELAIKELTKWVEMFVLYLYVANNFDSAKIKRLLAVMFVAGCAEAAIGIYQFLFRVGPEGFALFGRFMRAYGTFEQPNPFAGYLALIAPVALGVVMSQVSNFWSQISRAKLQDLIGNFGMWLAACITLVATLVAIVMSWSRGAWLGVGAGLIFALIAQSRRAFTVTVIGAFVLTFVILMSSINLVPAVIADRFSGVADYFGVFDVRGVKVDDANYAIVERMAHWQSAAMMFADKPLLGVGIGNYVPAYPAYALPHWSDPLGHAHNYYLNIAAETGILGLSAYLILWGAIFWQAWRAVRVADGIWRSIAAGLLGMFVALSIHNGFDDLFVHGMTAQVGIALGLVSVIATENAKRKQNG